MAKGKESLSSDLKYVKLIVYPKRRAANIMICLLLTILATFWIDFHFLKAHVSAWQAIALPIILLGSLLVFLLPTEEWSYGPWQDASQKYEKNIYD